MIAMVTPQVRQQETHEDITREDGVIIRRGIPYLVAWASNALSLAVSAGLGLSKSPFST